MFDNDIDVLLGDFGVPCSSGAINFAGLLDMPDSVFDIGGMSIQSGEYSLTYRTGAVSLATGDMVTVDGTSYVVRSPANRLDDGAFSAVKLSKP